MPALTPDNDIFISYSRLDTSRIKPAISILKASGADVFLDTEDIEYGQEWSKALDDNIKEAERIFVFWSKNSAKSVEVRKEYQKAIALGSVEPPAADALPLTYPLILLFSIILLTALPAIYIWNRRRNRLIKALRAELFPQEK